MTASAIMGRGQKMGVDAEGEGRISVAEVLGQFLDGDTAC
jgi:hypothetical protein